MALDREKTFANAERLLKQGKVREALEECRRLAEDAPRDLLMLNRVGDLLARSGRGAEAVVYYEKIAEQFSASGFYPKAIAILKKVLKVDASRVEVLVQLGELNARQKLPREARAWLLQAAEAYLRARQFAKAREVYEKLVKVEPESFVHPVRLAETRAAEGDAERAARDLVALAERMLSAGRVEDAERTLRRASEVLPGRAEALLGLARVHAAAGRRDEALAALERAAAAPSSTGGIPGEVLVLFEQLGAADRAAALLAGPKADLLEDDAVERAFREAASRGAAEEAWGRLEPLLVRWTRAKAFDRAGKLLDRLATLEAPVAVRALERAVALREAEGATPKVARALEALVRALRTHGAGDRAAPLLEKLGSLDPGSSLLEGGRAAPQARPAAAQAPAPQPKEEARIDVAYEAPAVPLTPADEEFVSGHLTEAEVFEKYGLHAEALAQLQEVARRFPGHVPAQEKLVAFLRTQSDPAALRDALVALAFATRASGDAEGARRAAGEAARIGGIDPAAQIALARLGIGPPAPPKAAEPPAAAAPAPPAPPPAATAGAAPAEEAVPEGEEELEILFEDADEAGAAAEEMEAAEAVAAESAIEEEIAFYIDQGMVHDALARIAEARASGSAAPALDALEARARAAAGARRPPAAPEPVAGDKLDEEDLSSIAAALEAEYGGAKGRPPIPRQEPEAEPSVDEVFAAFKEHVAAEVEGSDFRTHYDLGIAYKEMGLVDDAIAEFRRATGAPELYREACSMLGLIHWERGEAKEAIRWYRSALGAPGEEDTPLSGLRYDLAEILLATGDDLAAYDLFAQVLAVDPAYRDVRDRVDDLKRKLRL